MIIDKNNLPYEHVKQVNVVHPSGKFFMGLILEIIQIATKEILHKKYRTTDYEKSLDLDAALATAKNVTQVETDLQRMMNEDVKVIKERSHEIQELLSKIVGQENLSDYEKFISEWLEYLKEQKKAIHDRNTKIDEVVTKARKLFENAQEMLKKKEFKLETVPSETLTDTSLPSLIACMKKTLPVIKNFITSYPVGDVAVTEEEKQTVKQKLKELEQMDEIAKTLSEKCQILITKSSKLESLNEDHELLGNDNTFCGDNDNWKLSAFTESTLNFEASKNCMSSIDLKAFNQIALLDENDNVVRAPSHFNQTFAMNMEEKTFKAPPSQPALPSRRKRRDPMELLNKATSSVNSRANQSFIPMDNSMMMAPLKGPTSTPLPALSSTMLSPDIYGKNNNLFNFSTVSEISVMSLPRPRIESAIDETLEVKNVNKIQSSPVKLCMGVRDITNSKDFLPKITVSDATLTATVEGNNETVVEKENFGCELSTMVQRKSIADEDLFNVSDSCLNDVPED